MLINVKERNFMKSLTTLIALVAFLTMALSAGAMAQCGYMGGPMQFGPAPAVAPETLKKFNMETKGLQEQLIDKQAQLKKELLKEDPDPDAIAKLRKDMIDIQAGIQKVAKKLGMKNYCVCPMSQGNGCGGGCGGGMGGGMRGCGPR